MRTAITVLSQFRRLFGLCIRGPGGRASLVLFIVVVALKLGSVYATVRILQWTGAFYSALEKVDGPELAHQIGIFAMIVGLNSVRHLISEYLRKRLEIRWRQRLTSAALDIWTGNKAYWHLAHGAAGIRIDNPDQRIAEDSRQFVSGVLSEAIDLIERVVGLFSYLAVLWGLSNFPLAFSVFGVEVEIARYMIWAAFLYVALSSGITHLLGRPLKSLLSEQQRREASFRFAMARWRTAFDEVALSGGEMAERRTFDRRFDAIVGNWRRLIRRELLLGCFTYPFNHSVLRIPLFVALPGYLGGHIAFGGLMQLGTAFSSVVTTLSWFIFSYRDLADLVAASSRLDGFLQTAKACGAGRPAFDRAERRDGITISEMAVAAPDGRALLEIPNFALAAGETVWLRGASGIGKTTLVKSIAGLWPHGRGRVAMPAEGCMFLPQRIYLPIGDLLDAAAYPSGVAGLGRAHVVEALQTVGLGHRLGERVGSTEGVPEGLSGGELQRLALARVLLHRPAIVFLDEATSALDLTAEAELLALVQKRLPATAFVVIAHRQPVGLRNARIVELGPVAAPQSAFA